MSKDPSYPYNSFNNKRYRPRYPGEIASDGKMTSQRTYTSTADPDANHDVMDSNGIGDSFEAGDRWHNTTDKTWFTCEDNSQGAADWEPNTSFVPSTGLEFGQIYEEDGTGTLVLAAQDTWYQIVEFTANGPSTTNITPDFTNDHLTVTNAGFYQVSFSVSFSQSTAVSIEYDFHIRKNNGATTFENTSQHRNTNGNQSVGSLAATGILQLLAGDTIELWVMRLGGGATDRTITIVVANIVLIRLS